MASYYRTLQTQRFDDYRYYHQSRINQTLHLISAVIFLVTYALLFKDPAMAGLIGWLAMLTRQTGHFFFEPNGYDKVNEVTNEYKETIKVGYNQKRKIVLLLVWGMVPVMLFVFPTLFGLFAAPVSRMDFVRHVGLLWLAVGIGGGLFRTIQLFAIKDVGTGLTWAFKVLTDPFHNIALYWKSPLALARGELIDPTIKDASHWGAVDDEIEAEEAAHLT
ncbi:Mpo1-like protein [Bradyrhizobium sp. SZCCHNS1054]|uniref:Mpo1-like protein n=1 Tax=Bradyrhizobium sp. SZCCHNS1054 TaxID=3057301 RepID=UPI002917079F|nr:Mpo1-like protein [Bradyrhizobium sp. SZCCHNS1054]